MFCHDPTKVSFGEKLAGLSKYVADLAGAQKHDRPVIARFLTPLVALPTVNRMISIVPGIG